jgi:hypothetical protein
MKIKHLFVFLLVLVISVANSNLYSQKSSDNYFQSSKTSSKRKINYRNTNFVAFNPRILANNYFLAFFAISIDLKGLFQNQIQLTLKLQNQLHQKIASINIQRLLLQKKFTTSNSISNLYIA